MPVYFTDPPGQLEREFWDYHAENPEVYQLIRRYTREVINRGLPTYAIEPIWCRMRWHLEIEVRTAFDFKFPNNHRAYYSRLWLRDHPTYPEFFKTARLRSVDPGPVDRFGRDEDDDPEDWDD